MLMLSKRRNTMILLAVLGKEFPQPLITITTVLISRSIPYDGFIYLFVCECAIRISKYDVHFKSMRNRGCKVKRQRCFALWYNIAESQESFKARFYGLWNGM